MDSSIQSTVLFDDYKDQNIHVLLRFENLHNEF